jgi:phosphoheptose isomerase
VRAPRFVLLAVAVPGVACGGGGSSTTPSEVASGLTGTWRVTRAQYVSATHSTQSVDVISQGTTMTLAFRTDGTFTLRIVDPGQEANVVTGTWTSSPDVLTIVPTGAPGDSQFDMALDGNNLSLSGGHVEYDFGDDGLLEEAILNMDLTHG